MTGSSWKKRTRYNGKVHTHYNCAVLLLKLKMATQSIDRFATVTFITAVFEWSSREQDWLEVMVRGGVMYFFINKLLQKLLIPRPPYIFVISCKRPFIEKSWEFTATKANLNVIYMTMSYLHKKFIYILFKLQSQANLFSSPRACVCDKYKS